MVRWSRRDLLRAASAACGSTLAGCGSAPNGASDPTTTPETADSPTRTTTATTATGTTDTTSAPCGEESKRVDADHVVAYGSLAGLELDVAPGTVELGSRLTVEMTNTADATRLMGTPQKYNVQRPDDEGWRSIYRVGPTDYWTDEAYALAPGEGFAWEFEFTPEGMAVQKYPRPEYHVCPELSAGRYRFLVWDVGIEADVERDAVGVRFDVIES